MSLILEPPLQPLRTDETGTVRVGGTRVTLDTVIGFYKQGSSAEDIADSFPVLKLWDIYATIAYYLAHQPEVDEYLETRRLEAGEMQKKMEALFPPQGLREKLLARQKASKK